MIGRPRLVESLPQIPRIDVGYPKELPTEELDGKRHYKTPANQLYPSITTVLSGTKDTSFLVEWRKRVGEEEAKKITANSARRGTGLHSIAENYLEGNQTWFDQQASKLPHESVLLWRQIQPLIDRHVTHLYGTEVPLYSDACQVAGRVDCIAKCDGIPTIVDFKNSRKLKRKEWIEDYFIQITAYAIMHFDLTGIMIPEGRIWIAVEGEQAAQEFRFRTAHYIGKFQERRSQYRAMFGR